LRSAPPPRPTGGTASDRPRPPWPRGTPHPPPWPSRPRWRPAGGSGRRWRRKGPASEAGPARRLSPGPCGAAEHPELGLGIEHRDGRSGGDSGDRVAVGSRHGELLRYR
jgi:hypothetical protein